MEERWKGKIVTFEWEAGRPGLIRSGMGEVISEPDEKGRVQVACYPDDPREARHFVIFCTTTWLKPAPEKPATLPVPA